VPTKITPRPSAASSTDSKRSRGNDHHGWTSVQNRVAKPNAHTSVVTGSSRCPARSDPTMYSANATADVNAAATPSPSSDPAS
jgi:hypothetical protein